MGWTCSTEKEHSQHSIGFRAPTVHRHWGGGKPPMEIGRVAEMSQLIG